MGGEGVSYPPIDPASIPKPATSAPPEVKIDSERGDDLRYALANHTHKSRLQARRIQVTPNASGQYVYVFPQAYDIGVVPIVNVTAETPSPVTFRLDASIVEGSTTNTQTTILITKLNANIVMGLLNAVIGLFTPQTAPTWVNIMSRAPS